MKKLLLFGALAFGLNTFGQVPSYVPSNGLVGWWPFNGNANDESGNGNNGSISGASLANDRFNTANSAYQFNGTNNYILVSSIPTNNAAYSISVWAKANAINQAINGIAVQTGLKNGTRFGSFGIRATDQGTRFIGVHRNNAGTLQVINNPQNQDLNWHHYVQTWNGSQVKIYVDGILLSTVNINSSSTRNPQFTIGAMYETSFDHFFTGVVDDVGFWTIELSPCQVQDLFNAQLNSTAFSVTQNGPQLTADQSGATYQWLTCDNNYAAINGETNQTYTPAVTGNYAVEVNMNGCIDTSACFLVDYTGIEELIQSEKELVMVIDFMGRETEFKPNTPLIFIYNDGTRERVMKLEE